MKTNIFKSTVPTLSPGALLVGVLINAAADWTKRVIIKDFLSGVYQRTDQDDVAYDGKQICPMMIT